jgi:hypothetical protein
MNRKGEQIRQFTELSIKSEKKDIFSSWPAVEGA